MAIYTLALVFFIGVYTPQIISAVLTLVADKKKAAIQDFIQDAADHFVAALDKLELQIKMDKLVKDGLSIRQGLAITDSERFDNIDESFDDCLGDDDLNQLLLFQEDLVNKKRRSKVDKKHGDPCHSTRGHRTHCVHNCLPRPQSSSKTKIRK
jgi:hypothetical protein